MRPLRVLPLVVSLAAGCAAAGDAGDTGTETVLLTVDHRSEWRQLWIEGTTDLPDGASVNYRVAHELSETAPAETWPAPNLIVSGRSTVKEGQYWATVNTLNWPRGNVRVTVQFPLPPQPPAVDTRYGAFGEHLTGDNVTSVAGLKVVEVEHLFEHRR